MYSRGQPNIQEISRAQMQVCMVRRVDFVLIVLPLHRTPGFGADTARYDIEHHPLSLHLRHVDFGGRASRASLLLIGGALCNTGENVLANSEYVDVCNRRTGSGLAVMEPLITWAAEQVIAS